MGGGNDPVDQAAAVAAGGGGEGEATIHIRCSNGNKFSVRTGLGATVRDFKAVLSGRCDVPAEQQRLIYKGRILKDEQTLESYGLESEHTVHLVRGFASPEAPTDATNLGASRSSNNNTGVASNGAEGGGFGGASFPGISANGPGGTEASGLFGFGFPDFDQMQQQLTQNPNMMRELMNMPVIQSLMNNPELIRNLIMSNPQMRELIDRNPDIAHVLNDPRTLQQTLEAARNPELMREMMRNTDRAMSNIESSPEGFNMLRRMYETVQEPFLNATTMGGNTENNSGSNPFAALLGNRDATQSRDQSSNPSTTSTESAHVSPAPNTNPLPNPWNSTGGVQTTNLESAPASDVRTPGSAGLGGFGLPDPSLLNQVVQNPAMAQMMQSLLSNSQFMNQISGSNPQLRGMLESNTQMRDMLQNPDFIRQLTSPDTVQQLLSLQQSLFSQLARQQNNQGQNQASGGTGMPNNTGLDFLMNMFGGLGAGGFGAPNTSNVPPEELYATQLSQLQEMGFFDTQENIRALTATSGNVHAAVERLLRNLGQ